MKYPLYGVAFRSSPRAKNPTWAYWLGRRVLVKAANELWTLEEAARYIGAGDTAPAVLKKVHQAVKTGFKLVHWVIETRPDRYVVISPNAGGIKVQLVEGLP